MSGLIGKKIGMTSFFDANGKYQPCTVIEAGPCVVTQVKTNEKDGYTALQLSFDEKKEKNTSSAMKGHFELAKTTPKRRIVEFRHFDESKKIQNLVIVKVMPEKNLLLVKGSVPGAKGSYVLIEK